jgi:hypothetical protein
MKKQILKLLQNCNNKGSFIFRFGDSLSLVSQGVPNAPGDYLIYAYFKNGKILLVRYGKSGMLKDGTFTKHQGLYKRLNNVGRGDISREQIFSSFVIKNDIQYLKVHWFVTWDNTLQINPCNIEKQLYQYFPIPRVMWLD